MSLETLREMYNQNELDQDRNPTTTGFLEWLATKVESKDTWQSGLEIDAMLGQLRGDQAAVDTALHQMSVRDLADFGRHLYALQDTLAHVAMAQIRAKDRAARQAEAD